MVRIEAVSTRPGSMKANPALLIMLIATVILTTSCASGGPAGLAGDKRSGISPVVRTLVMVTRIDQHSYAANRIGAELAGGGGEDWIYLFNAALVVLDDRELPQPFLAEGLPELNTETWKVFPDGKMETTYRLKPNLTWHDGRPLTADDFAFSWRVSRTPEFGISESGGFRFIEEVAALDPRTVLISWKQSFKEAGAVWGNVLPPLPRHLLEQPFQDLARDPFLGIRFWTDEYVGAGPLKLERHEPGILVEASAFDAFVFGRPKIDRVRVVFVPDANTIVANMLTGEAHYTVESAIFGEQGLALERGWGTAGGKVLWEPNQGRALEIQSDPEFAVPVELATDPRVRQALAYTIDKAALNDALTGGHGFIREIFTHPDADYYDTVLRGVTTRYSYDPRRAPQLLQEAGFTRGAESFWATPRGERFTLEQWYIAQGNNENESVILLDTLRRSGIDASGHVWGIQRTSNEERSKTSGIFAGSSGNDGYSTYTSRNIPRPETRWLGQNRLRFTTPEVDRLIDAWNVELDRSARIQQIAQLERIASEVLPSIVTYWNPRAIAHADCLNGVMKKLMPDAGKERRFWEWEWRC